jgi:hypothetical protein
MTFGLSQRCSRSPGLAAPVDVARIGTEQYGVAPMRLGDQAHLPGSRSRVISLSSTRAITRLTAPPEKMGVVDIEALAVSKIQAMVARCQRLQPFLDSNDKTPFTDGHIDLYKSSSRKKQDSIGRVYVQVKGRKATRRRPKVNKFPISRTDLLVFQREGGVLYFVVSIDDAGHGTPYYAVLTPFIIDHILDKAPVEQASVSVPVRHLPHAPREIESIAHVALKGRAQNPSLGIDPVLFERMQSITVTSTSKLNWEEPFTLAPGDTDFVLEMKTSSGASVPLPGILQIFPPGYVAHQVEATVRAGDIAYDHPTARRIDPETSELVLGGGLSLVLAINSPEKRFTINVTAHSNFAERYKALEFIVALVDHKQFEVNGETLRLGHAVDGEDPGQQIVELRGYLALLRSLHELFEHLGVDDRHIDLGEISEEQFENLRKLYNVFIRREQMILAAGKPGWAIIELGQWALMVLIRPGDAPDRWRLIDPFHPEAPQSIRVRLELEEEGVRLVTPYDIIEKENVPRLLNLRLDSVTQAYDAIKESDILSARATLFVLELISAADKCPPRKEEFLRGAKKLNEWVIERDGEAPAQLVNRWQIEWRNEALTDPDRDAIRELKHSILHTQEPLAREIELACSLLLEDTDETAYLVGKMPDVKLRQMQEWPIWRLRD